MKSVTLLQKGRGYFPDAVTVRGQKHLRELASIARRGERAVMLFTVLHSGIEDVSPARHIDARYAEELAQAQQSLCYKAQLSPTGMWLENRLELAL